MKWLDRLAALRAPPPIDDILWHQGLAHCPIAQRLPADEQARLRQLATDFLHHKRFHPVDTHLDVTQRLLIAMQASIPVLHMDSHVLRGWRSVIVYPGEFRVRNDRPDPYTGLVSEQAEIRAGEAWPAGPLVLSWAAVEQSLSHPWDGFNVVIHEIAHKLDMRNGPPDGLPVLPREIKQNAWIDTFQRAYERLIEATRNGEYTGIDTYATTNPSEYFAVVSEMYFSAPGKLAEAEPGVAALLREYYGDSPAP
ncbi:MAG TPA: M90 family metallopeptidase [Oleiagrimonas sp.]|nr:M90 family metallopeptidase [Oleiagrimonas sp.]